MAWNRLVQRPSGVLVDADESLESSVDAIVCKFVCVPMAGESEAESMLAERSALCGMGIDWRDRIFIMALPRTHGA